MRSQDLLIFTGCLLLVAVAAARVAEPATLVGVDFVLAGKLSGWPAAVVVQLVRDGSVLFVSVLLARVLDRVHRAPILSFSFLAAIGLALLERGFAARQDSVVAAYQGTRLIGRLSALCFALTLAAGLDLLATRPARRLRQLAQRGLDVGVLAGFMVLSILPAILAALFGRLEGFAKRWVVPGIVRIAGARVVVDAAGDALGETLAQPTGDLGRLAHTLAWSAAPAEVRLGRPALPLLGPAPVATRRVEVRVQRQGGTPVETWRELLEAIIVVEYGSGGTAV